VFWVLSAIAVLPVLVLLWQRDLMPGAVAPGRGDQARSVLDLLRIPPLRMTIIAGSVIGSAQDLFQFYMPVYGHAIVCRHLRSARYWEWLRLPLLRYEPCFLMRQPNLRKRISWFGSGDRRRCIHAAAAVRQSICACGDRLPAWVGCGQRRADDSVTALRVDP
jgi:hypothetical protein